MLLNCLFLLAFTMAADLPRLEPGVCQELSRYLETHGALPEDYVISKFKDHDVVLIGEYHRIKQDPELVQALIPRLYRDGIYVLGSEFARRQDQKLIDRLVTSPTYDEALAREIQFNGFVFWGYQEYLDIYRVAWRLNSNLPPNARRFRILGLCGPQDWSLFKTEQDSQNPEIRRQVFRQAGEELWAKVILDEVVAKHEKALVYCGIHHAVTGYKLPVLDEQNRRVIRLETERMGNYIFAAIGKRAMTIFLHSPWPPAEGYGADYQVRPVDGAIDALMAEAELKDRRVGFDIHGSPFGLIGCSTSVYRHGYKCFTLDTFCDGYIYQKPLSAYEGVTPIPDFINDSNIEKARTRCDNLRFRHATVSDFNRAIAADSLIKRRFGNIRNIN